MAHQLKPPQRTIADICLLPYHVEGDEKRALIDQSRRYLQTRTEMIDYAHFQAHGFPIGSGSVESSHKLVVHSQMKQAGMRWAKHHVDPLLALRNLVCNGRWSDGWSQIVTAHWQQRRAAFRAQAKRQRPSASPITFASVKVAPVSSQPHPPQPDRKRGEPYRPAPDHPWRRDIWPTKEVWRWS